MLLHTILGPEKKLKVSSPISCLQHNIQNFNLTQSRSSKKKIESSKFQSLFAPNLHKSAKLLKLEAGSSMPAKSSHFLKTEHSSFLSNGCQDKRKTPQHILCTPLDKIHKKEYATFADQYNYCCLIAQTPQNFHPRNIVSSSLVPKHSR